MRGGGLSERLDPALLWRRFEELTAIPRPSRREHAAAEHVRAWARSLDHRSETDAYGNVVVRVPATPGREQAPSVVLQAHLDMVCERAPGSGLDPAAGRIRLVEHDGWVVADETTLGADDGIGVAAMLALGEQPAGPHGPLELLFTLAEEVGLEGALELDPALVSGRLLLNLDGTDAGALIIGCAGSTTTQLTLSAQRQDAGAGSAFDVALHGGRGGHSGLDVTAGRSNAIADLACVLDEAARELPLRLVTLAGGHSRNAIPREASAHVLVPARDGPGLRERLASAFAPIANALRATDGALALAVEPADAPAQAFTAASTRALLAALQALPCGVLEVSAAAPGLVEASSSIGIAESTGETVLVTCLTRAGSDRAAQRAVGAIRSVATLAGGDFEEVASYPAWPADAGTPAVLAARAAYRLLFSAEPALAGVHMGLECAAFRARLPGVSMVSFGPTIEGAHAPGERVEIASVERFWQLLAATLDELSR